MKRYAIYFAPPEGSALEAFGRSWMGRDHVTGEAVPPPAVPGISPERQRALAAFPRHYGFHATLKAPFELHAGQSREALLSALDRFVAVRPSFTAPPVEPMGLSGFVAFKLTRACERMDELAAACVRAFEPFRAPLRQEDVERRRAGRLTERQDRYLLEWGYPYVFEEFRFHMTLTGRLEEPERTRVLDAIRKLAAPVGGRPLRVDAVSLYEQSCRDDPFLLTARFPLRGA